MSDPADDASIFPLSVSPEACPVCGRPALPRRAPFCSTRCANVDLNRWLGEAYRVPAETETLEAPGEDEI